jgi:hypothetical protein
MPAQAKRGRRELGTEVEQAKELGISPVTLKVSRSTGVGDFATLRWYRIGNKIRYDLTYTREEWLPARQHGGDEAAA